MRIQIDIAPGELVDRVTILEIKLARIDNPDKLKHVTAELKTLTASLDKMREWIAANSADKLPELHQHTVQIKEANAKIWDVLQKQRELEQDGSFGREFIEVSLDVYHTNDERADGKRKINELFNTDIAEVKHYT